MNRQTCRHFDLEAVATGICKQGINLKDVSDESKHGIWVRGLPCVGGVEGNRCRYFSAPDGCASKVNLKHEIGKTVTAAVKHPVFLFGQDCPVCAGLVTGVLYAHLGTVEVKVRCDSVDCIDYCYPQGGS